MSTAPTTASKPQRRWLQFSLRTMMVVVLLAGGGMGWFAYKLKQARRQRTKRNLRPVARFPVELSEESLGVRGEGSSAREPGLNGTKMPGDLATVRRGLPRLVTDGGIAVNRCVLTRVVALLLPAAAAAEVYTPPANVRDPSQQAKVQWCDRSLPLIYLEPHDFCYDIARPLAVTLSAVNRSKEPQSIDWRAICGSLVLEPVGSGRVTPVRNRPTPESVPLASMDLAQVTIDLREWFQIEGVGVYRLSYARPLEDGRIHIAAPARFVIEDDAAVEKLAAELDAGPVRETFAVLLKDNPVFAAGGLPKTYGWDRQEWGSRPQMLHSPWDEALHAARQKLARGDRAADG